MSTDPSQPPGDQNIHGDEVRGDKVMGDKVMGDKVVIQHAPRTFAPPIQLPPCPEHFLGRDEELARLLASLQPGQVVTLCGPGGIGKTALASAAVWQLTDGGKAAPVDFPDGVFFHSFYNQPSTGLVFEEIAGAFGEEARPTPAAAAQRALAGRCALLILDGAEQAEDLDAVLSIRGRCCALVTTRLHSGQNLAPLDLEDAARLLEAVGGERACQAEACRQVCELVGRLPLAVWIAGRYLAEREMDAGEYAAWLSATPLEALEQGDRRRDSVPLLLERSLGQVGEGGRAALPAIGCLALAAFEPAPIAAALGIAEAQAQRALGDLVRFGLLRRQATGYEVYHALVHTYARGRLSLEDAALERLADYYTALATEQAGRGLAGHPLLDAARPHVLALLERLEAAAAWSSLLDLARTVKDYLDLQGHTGARLLVCQYALDAARASGGRYDEGAWLNSLGLTYRALGQVEKAIDYHEQSLAIAREIGDRRGEGADLGSLGIAYHSLGQVKQAIEYHEQSLAIAREIGDRRGECADLGNLGLAYSALGQVEKAIEYHEQALAIDRETGDRRGEGADLGNLGNAYYVLGQVEQAIEHHKQALAIAREIGDRRNEGTHLGNLGLAYRDLGQVEKAIEYYRQALAIARETGDRRMEGSVLGNLGNAYRDLGQVEQAIEHYRQALAIARETGDRRGEGNRLGNLGIAYRDLGQVEKAIEHYRQALAIARETGDRRNEGIHLNNLGNAYRDLGQVEQARRCLQQAYAIFLEIQSPDAERARRSLEALDG